MTNHQRHAYSAFAGDHRKFRATKKGAFAPTLRIKALAGAFAIGALFWGSVIYLLTR